MSAPTQRPNLESGSLFDVYTSVATDLDLTTAYPGYVQGMPARLPRLVVYSGGILVVEDVQGTSVTLPAALAGVPLPIAPAGLVSAGTTATAILVVW